MKKAAKDLRRAILLQNKNLEIGLDGFLNAFFDRRHTVHIE